MRNCAHHPYPTTTSTWSCGVFCCLCSPSVSPALRKGCWVCSSFCFQAVLSENCQCPIPWASAQVAPEAWEAWAISQEGCNDSIVVWVTCKSIQWVSKSKWVSKKEIWGVHRNLSASSHPVLRGAPCTLPHVHTQLPLLVSQVRQGHAYQHRSS